MSDMTALMPLGADETTPPPLTAPGLDVVGPFPAELQQEVVFTAAIAMNAREGEAAKAFVRYLTTPAAAAVIKSSGMTPG